MDASQVRSGKVDLLFVVEVIDSHISILRVGKLSGERITQSLTRLDVWTTASNKLLAAHSPLFVVSCEWNNVNGRNVQGIVRIFSKAHL